jgi:hypothetical protein
MTDNETLIKLMCHPAMYRKVTGILSLYCRDRDAVRDAVSDVMLAIMENMLTYTSDKRKPESFIIAHARYRLAKARTFKTISLDAPAGDGKCMPGDLLSGGCNIDEATDRMDVIHLMKFGLPARRIATFLDIPPVNIMTYAE